MGIFKNIMIERFLWIPYYFLIILFPLTNQIKKNWNFRISMERKSKNSCTVDLNAVNRSHMHGTVANFGWMVKTGLYMMIGPRSSIDDGL